MSKSRRSVVLAVSWVATSLISGASLAQETPATPVEPVVAVVEEAVEPRTPLMQLLDKAGVGKTLDDYNISLGGWVEASVTWSLLDDPAGDEIVGRAFDFEHADPTLNQIGFTAIRPVDPAKPWDFGFGFEHIYGADARFTASNGMDFQTGDSPENQFDITQLYAELVLPIGKGLVLKAGKWITPIGYEYVNPTLNPLYSHSYLFGIVPFSHTGIMATYPISETSTFSLALARGWEQSLRDNNGDAIELVFSFANTPNDKVSYAFNGSVGPQEDDDSSHYRTMLDFWMDYAYSDQLSFGLNVDWRYDSNLGQDGDEALTYGVAGYVKYVIDSRFTAVGRLEWFNDTSRVDGFDCNIYAATFGVNVTPFPDDAIGQFFKLRPEIRYDYATEAIFNGGEDHNLLTAAIEGVFTF